MTVERITGWRRAISRVEFAQFFGCAHGMLLAPGRVHYAEYFWRDVAVGRIVITSNHRRQTFSAFLDGVIVGARYYTVENAARAAVRVMRSKQP